jgi:hypothetical protein
MPSCLIEPFDQDFHDVVIMKVLHRYSDSNSEIYQYLKVCYPNEISSHIPTDCKNVEYRGTVTYTSVKFDSKLDYDKLTILNDNSATENEKVQLENYFVILLTFDKPRPNTTPDVYVSLETVNALKNSFEGTVSTLGGKQKEILLKYLNGCLKLFSNNRYFAPYCTVCQSSGYGKSKLVLECGSHVPLVYGVFRSENEKAFPCLSPWIKDFYHVITKFEDQDQEKSILAYFLSVMEAYFDLYLELFSDIKFEENVTLVMKELVKLFSTEEGQKQFFTKVQVKLPSYFSDTDILIDMDDLLEKIKSLSIKVIHKLFESGSKSDSKSGSKSDLEYKPFVIVLDEASLLLEFNFEGKVNPLVAIRRALHQLPIESRLLIVVIGTNGDVSEYNKKVNEDSLRIISRKYILPPLVLSRNFDVLRDKFNLSSLKINCTNMKCKDFLKLLVTFGRPMWCSLLFSNIFTVAHAKLKNGSENQYTPFMAIWSIRVGLTINSDLKLVKTLLKSNMATAVSLSYASDNIYIDYPSEPILAIAARNMIKGKDFGTKFLFDQLLNFIQGRPIDKGQLVESILFQILLLAVDNSEKAENEHSDMAFSYPPEDAEFDNLFRKNTFVFDSKPLEATQSAADCRKIYPGLYQFFFFYHVTTVGSFLKSLFGPNKFDSFKHNIDKRMLNGLINVSHFVHLHRNFPIEKTFPGENIKANAMPCANSNKGTDMIDRALLRNFFIRQAGFVCPKNYYGLDGGIVVLLPRENSNDNDDIFSFIGLQMKSNLENVNNVISKMNINEHYVRCCCSHPPDECLVSDCKMRTTDADLEVIYDTCLTLYLSTERLSSISDVVVNHNPIYQDGETIAEFISEEADNNEKSETENSEEIETEETEDNEIYMESSQEELYKPSLMSDSNDETAESLVSVKKRRIAHCSASERLEFIAAYENSNVQDEDYVKSVYINGDVEIFKLKNQTCISVKSLNGFSQDKFLSESLIKSIEEIIHYRESPFGSTDRFNFNSVADSVLNCSFASFPDVDRSIRADRGYSEIPFVDIDYEETLDSRLEETVKEALIPPYLKEYKHIATETSFDKYIRK